MKLSIVTTLYYSSQYITEFYERIKNECKLITDDYEIIFVNDGSPDDSLNKVIEISKIDDKVVVIDLSRNFGQHKALMTGLSYAKGDLIFQIDVDLEEKPELLSLFYSKLKDESGADVIYGIQKKRRGNFFSRIIGTFFYYFFNKLTSIQIPNNIILARLMSKKYLTSLLKFNEKEVFLAGLWFAVGFKQVGIKIDKSESQNSTYNFSKKISLVINSITSFSIVPLLVIFYSGLCITFLSFCYIFHLFILKFFFGITITGWATIVASIWLFGGLIIFMLGIIGIYLSKIFIEVKNRPYTIIKKVYNKRYEHEKYI